MSIYQILYLAFLTSSLAISLYCYPSFQQNRSLKIFPFLLATSLLTEIVVNILHFVFHQNFLFMYHFYIPVEYAFLAYFFYLNSGHPTLRRIILFSIPAYLLVSIYISLKVSPINTHPGLNFNLEGILLILWSLITLLNVNPTGNLPIVRLPVFWICLGILIFHCGIFFFNGVYNYLLENDSQLAKQLHKLIIKNLNYLLYICFSTGFICSKQMKKYLLQ
jgi:hypothetical protein